ncbi:putative leucine-rich repeat domain superfamily [Helianthus annuus]|nr:putative leucine-rich repeat domain superfamily [Helianthus annuus]
MVTDEMYVLSASHKRVNVQLIGKDKIEDILARFEELPGASLSYLGVSSPGDPVEISKTLPKIFDGLETCVGSLTTCGVLELDLTGNLLSKWQDIDAICSELPALTALNLTTNRMSNDVAGVSHLRNLRLLVLNNVEVLKDSLQAIEELHLMGNKIREITDIRCSENPATDPSRGGIGRYALIARLAKIKILNGSEVNSRPYVVYCRL